MEAYGLCERALGPQEDKNQYNHKGPDTRESPMLVQDMSWCAADLYTKAKHCCNEWCKEKPKVEEEPQVPYRSMIERSKQELARQNGDRLER